MTTAPPIHYAKTVDGLYIAYQDVGPGAIPLVFFNGMYSHIEVYWEWSQFARFVRRLATRLRVLHLDRRGTGMSDRVADVPTLEHSLDDINAVLATAGVDRPPSTAGERRRHWRRCSPRPTRRRRSPSSLTAR